MHKNQNKIKCIKAKIKSHNGRINTNFPGNRIPKKEWNMSICL